MKSGQRRPDEDMLRDERDIIIIIIIIVLYYRLAEHIDRYMAVVQYIVITLHTQVQLLSSQ